MSDNKPISSGLLWGARLLLLIALAVSSYLLYHSLSGGGQLAGCGADSAFDCETVLTSKWSKVWEIPTSALAIAIYVITLGALNLVKRPNTTLAKLIAGVCAMSIIGSGVWFTYLQLVILKTICIWCMTAHVTGLIGSILILIAVPKPQRLLSLVGIMPVLAMLSIQINTRQITHTVQTIEPAAQSDAVTPTDTPQPADGQIRIGRNQVLLMGNRVAIDPHKHPVLGSPDAKEFLMYLFDYTCPHCRALHGNLKQAIKRYGDQLAIIALPMPLNSDCNPLVSKNEDRHQDACSLAILALAVYKTKHRQWYEFQEWLGKITPDLTTLRAKAVELSGSEEALDKIVSSLYMSDVCDCKSKNRKAEIVHTDQCTRKILKAAVYKMTYGTFIDFDTWLIETVPDAATARTKAIELFGSEEALDKAIADPWIAKEIQRDVKLYELSGGGVIPKLIGKNTLIAGRPGDVLDLYDLLEDELGLVPVDEPAGNQ